MQFFDDENFRQWYSTENAKKANFLSSFGENKIAREAARKKILT